jgi:hypothetical protein
VIRERFLQYRRLTPRVVTTMQPVQLIAREVIARLTEATDILGSATELSNERWS